MYAKHDPSRRRHQERRRKRFNWDGRAHQPPRGKIWHDSDPTSLDAGLLGLYLTQRTSRLGLIRHALRALFGRLNQAKDFEAFTVKEAGIETHRRRLLVAWDGEIAWMETPLHYRTRPGALRVLVPNDIV